jgi:hypothetical protein
VSAPTTDQYVGLRDRARHLAWATVAWNVIEAVVAIIAGAAAGSAALVGFGLGTRRHRSLERRHLL